MQTTTTQRSPISNRRQYSLPIFPHLKKFIVKNYGAGVITTEEGTVLGRIVTAVLRENRTRKFSARDWPHHLQTTAMITIRLTTDQAGLSPKLSKLMRINLDMDKVFKDSLVGWILAQGEAGILAYPACKSFLDYYGIDSNEYSLDAAYKYWQRARKQ